MNRSETTVLIVMQRYNWLQHDVENAEKQVALFVYYSHTVDNNIFTQHGTF